MYWYIAVLKKYAVFSGRARRKEYWMFTLFNATIGFSLGLIGGISGINTGILSNIYSFGVLIPGIAVGVRRMHDVGKSGWFLLIPIYNLILTVREGTKGDNQYGSDPKSNA